MLQYKTGIPTTPPLSPDFRAKALAGLSGPATPWSGAGSVARADAYDALAQRNAVNYDRSAQMANAEFVQQARDLQSQMSQRGLQQMAQSQQNQTDLGNRRRQEALDTTKAMLGSVNGLLGGLFR